MRTLCDGTQGLLPYEEYLESFTSYGEHVARAAMEMDNEMMKSESFGLERPPTVQLLKDGIAGLVSDEEWKVVGINTMAPMAPTPPFLIMDSNLPAVDGLSSGPASKFNPSAASLSSSKSWC